MWFLGTVAAPLLQRWTGYTLGLYLQPVLGYTGYFVIGAALSRHLPACAGRRLLGLAGAVFLAGAAVAAGLTDRLAALSGGRVDEVWLDPLALTTAAMALSAFVLLRHVGSRPWLSQAPAHSVGVRMLANASALSFGVYLVHPIIIDCLDAVGLTLDPLTWHPAWYLPVMVILTVVVSALTSALVQRWSATRWLMP